MASGQSQLVLPQEESLAHQTARETSSAVVGSLVGLALGGPIGGVVGAAAAPVLSTTLKVAVRALQRRRDRAERILTQALAAKQIEPEQAVHLLETDDDKTDVFINLLSQAGSVDPGVEAMFESILGEILLSESAIQRDRLLIIADALRGMRSIHMRLLASLQAHGGARSAEDLAADVGIPEIELRSVVRDLEMRGMIKDCNVHPIQWEIRALGRGIIEYSHKKQGTPTK